MKDINVRIFYTIKFNFIKMNIFLIKNILAVISIIGKGNIFLLMLVIKYKS